MIRNRALIVSHFNGSREYLSQMTHRMYPLFIIKWIDLGLRFYRIKPVQNWSSIWYQTREIGANQSLQFQYRTFNRGWDDQFWFTSKLDPIYWINRSYPTQSIIKPNSKWTQIPEIRSNSFRGYHIINRSNILYNIINEDNQ